LRIDMDTLLGPELLIVRWIVESTKLIAKSL